MRTVIAVTSLVLLAGAVPPDVPGDPLAGLPGYEEPATRWKDVADAEARRACRETIEQARAVAGKPELDREPADPAEAKHFYAVDRSVDGCPVLVMSGDPADQRPVPQVGEPMLIPAR
ncbi:hypothetical protein [Qipengyuania sp.]|uniref:hypothetical protein n=1 Tax=Qipengyuania sp. TaxID=2004515 RepID=UPI0035C7F82C